MSQTVPLSTSKAYTLNLPLKTAHVTGGSASAITASLAVNGRPNRRVACVLDGTGIRMETLDMDAEDEGGSEEMDADVEVDEN